MAKIILLVRISTVRQEIEAQKNELKQLALADGWTEKDMIIVEGVGASAIKLNDVYLSEMDELYHTIDTNDIDAVYAWEISRIGRNEEILMRFKNHLIERGIQLVIKNPSLRLLNSDGTVNNGVELAFSLFATMSKQEMEIKNERFKRAKARNRLEGKFNGGHIKFGYRLNADKRFAVDEEKANIVRDVFNWYINGMTLKRINQKLVEMGIFHATDNLNVTGKKVGQMIREKAYIGDDMYPQIIPNEMFEKAQEMISKLPQWHESKNVYYCKGLLVDTVSGLKLTARSGTCVYYINRNNSKILVNINVMDYIAIHSANILYASFLEKQAQTNLKDYEIRIEQNNNIIVSKSKQIEELQKAIERAIEMNIAQPKYFPTEKMEAIIAKNDKGIEDLKRQIVDLQTENQRMENWLNGGNMTFINQIKKEYSDAKKKEIIDSVIERIEITKIEDHRFRVVIKNKIGLIDNGWYEYWTDGHKMSLVYHYPYGVNTDLTFAAKNHKRFDRKRYNGK